MKRFIRTSYAAIALCSSIAMSSHCSQTMNAQYSNSVEDNFIAELRKPNPDLSVLENLIDQEVDVNITIIFGNPLRKLTPLMRAIELKNINLFTFFLEHGADVNQHNGINTTNPLIAAVEQGDIGIVKLLFGEDNDQPVLDRATVLQQAENEWLALPLDVLNAYIAPMVPNTIDINQQNNEGKTALMKAAQRGNVPMVKWLLDHGADATLVDNDGNTARDYATNEETSNLLPEHTDRQPHIEISISAPTCPPAPELHNKRKFWE